MLSSVVYEMKPASLFTAHMIHKLYACMQPHLAKELPKKLCLISSQPSLFKPLLPLLFFLCFYPVKNTSQTPRQLKICQDIISDDRLLKFRDCVAQVEVKPSYF